MPYQWDHAFGEYGGYQHPDYSYGQPARQVSGTYPNAPQHAMQHPAAVVPSQQRGEMSSRFGQAPPPHFDSTSPHLSAGYGQSPPFYQPVQAFQSPSLSYPQQFEAPYPQQFQHQHASSAPSIPAQGFYHVGTPSQVQGPYDSTMLRPANTNVHQGPHGISARQQASQHMPTGHLQPSPTPVVTQSPHLTSRQPFQSDLRRSSSHHPHHSAFDSQLQTSILEQRHQQRVLARVEVPIQRVPSGSSQSEMPHSAKRRRSNEGHPIPVCEPSRPVPSVPTPVAPPAAQPLPTSQVQHTPQLDVDYQAVLLGLADEYINAAYRIASPSMTEAQQDEYSSLLATAIGCLQSSLVNYRDSDPRKEARIRLRLAALLIEETTNAGDAGDILSKGIALCERNRLADLKYTMHYLLVQQQYQSSSKRAFKAIDNLILEVEALQNLGWTYTFRLLRVTLSMQSGNHSDTAVLKHLSSLSSLAERHQHVAVQTLVPLLESLVHLTSNASDAVDLAQRSMATARAHQLSPEMQRMPQVLALLDCADLACALIKTQSGVLEKKMQQMQTRLDSEVKNKGWGKNGMFALEIGPSSNDDLSIDTCGLMRKNSAGNASLALQWLSKAHVFALGYLLSGLATASSKSHDKAIQFVEEGIKLVNAPAESFPQSLSSSSTRTHQHSALAVAMRLHIVFLHCGRYDWQSGLRQLQLLKQSIRSAEFTVDEATAGILAYQEALCKHGLGDLDGAMDIYRSPTLAPGKTSSIAALDDIRALAALNSVLILRARSSADSLAADEMLAAFGGHFDGHPNKSMQAAYFAVKATAEGSGSAIVKTKQHLNSAIWASKEASNQQLLCIVMNIMVKMFFTNIVGTQAEKSTKAGRELAAKAGNKLWLAVADAMYADNAARSGRPDEATHAELECRRAIKGLPPLVQQSLAGAGRSV